MENAAFKSTVEVQSHIRLTRIELKCVAFNWFRRRILHALNLSIRFGACKMISRILYLHSNSCFPYRAQASSPLWWCLAQGRLGKMWFSLMLQSTNLFHFTAVLHKFRNLIRPLNVSPGHSQVLISISWALFSLWDKYLQFCASTTFGLDYAIAKQTKTCNIKTKYEHLFIGHVSTHTGVCLVVFDKVKDSFLSWIHKNKF